MALPADDTSAAMDPVKRALTSILIFDELRGRWEHQVGVEELARIEATLTSLVGASPVRLDAPGWVAQEHGGLP